MKIIFALIFILNFNFSLANTFSISGISSGGFMAQQMSTIYSTEVKGVATVAGGFYFCAENYLSKKINEDKNTIGDQNLFLFQPSSKAITDSLNPFIIVNGELDPFSWFKPSKGNPIYRAVSLCMMSPDKAQINYKYIKENEDKKLIDNTSEISKQKVLIFHGNKDSVLDIKMQNQLKRFYQKFGVNKQNLKIIKGKGGHNFPINENKGIDCESEDIPYLGNCEYDLAKDILSHLESIKDETTIVNRDQMYMIDQTLSKLNIESNFKNFKQEIDSIAPYGYIYLTDFCKNNPHECKTHVVLHGCKMSDSYDDEFQTKYQNQVQNLKELHVKTKKDRIIDRLLGKISIEEKKNKYGLLKFAIDSGYLKYAEKNNLIIIFPQTWITTKNYPYNPKACWDWFGWTSEQYATKQGIEASWMHTWLALIENNPSDYLIKTAPNFSEMEKIFKD